MKQWRLLLPILGILVAAVPYILEDQRLIGAETILGILIVLASGVPLVTEYFSLGGGGKFKKGKSRFPRQLRK